MIRFMFLSVRDVARSRARLHLELLAMRHQLHVLQQTRSRRVRLYALDRWLWVPPVSGLDGLGASAGDRGAGDSCRVAPSRSPPVLDVEEPSPHGSPTCLAGGPESDSHRVADQSAVGCASHPRRTAEGGHRRLSGHRGEVHDPPPPPALPNLEDVPGEPRRTDHSRRFLRGTDGHVPPAPGPDILAHERRGIMRIAVTDHPIAAWTAQQLREAFPWSSAPRLLLRDRDQAFTDWCRRRRR